MTSQSKAIVRNLRMSPRKVRLVVDLIRGLSVQEALTQLALLPKKATTPVKKLLDSAIANAVHNHKLDKETLRITTAFVDGGPTIHRWMPRAFGRATPIRKRTSHVTIVLTGTAKEKEEEKKPIKKKTVKKVTKK